MSTDAQLIAAVRGLVQAENDGSREAAERFLSPDFAVISRSRNEEQGREAMLAEIGRPNPALRRTLEEDGFRVWPGGAQNVVRSTVALRDDSRPGTVRRFRNLHVFDDEDGQPRCVAWFVAEIPPPAS